MRIAFILIAACLIALPGISQDNDRPSQKEMEGQMKQALADARKQRDEFRKQIAEAKVSKQDPKEIKLLEDQLQSVEQMITMLERTDLTNNKPRQSLPESKIKEPAYVSPFRPIKLSEPVKTPSWEQATDSLLWYRGKRINASTLITPSGLIVRYDRSKNTIILQPPKKGSLRDSMYYTLVNTLNQIKPMKNRYAAGMDNLTNSFFMFPEIENAYKEFDVFKGHYYGLAKNTEQVQPTAGGSPLERKIADLAQFIGTLGGVKTILPPKRPNDLCLCEDPTAKAQYESDLDDWQQKFYEEELNLLTKLRDIFLHMDYIRQTGSVMPAIPASLNNPVEYAEIILDRMKIKLEELSKKYEQGQALVEDGMVLATVSLLKTLINLDENEVPALKNLRAKIISLFAKIQGLLESNIFETYIEKQKADLNFNAVFDYSLFAAHELNKKLFDDNSDVSENLYQKWMEGLKKFNRFKLSIELDFHYQVNSKEENDMTIMWAKGLLKNNSDIYVSLGRYDCQWVLYLTDVNHQNKSASEKDFRIKMKIESGQKDYVKDKYPPFDYSGPTTLQMVFPSFKFSFCGAESTVMMDVMTYANTDIKIHEHDDFAKMYTIDMLGFVNKMLLGHKQTELNASELISTSAKMINLNSSQLPESSGDPAFDKMKMEYLGNKKKYDLQYSLSQTTHTGKTVIPLTFSQPGSKLLFKPEMDLSDAKDKDREAGIMLPKALVRLKVEHSPK